MEYRKFAADVPFSLLNFQPLMLFGLEVEKGMYLVLLAVVPTMKSEGVSPATFFHKFLSLLELNTKSLCKNDTSSDSFLNLGSSLIPLNLF